MRQNYYTQKLQKVTTDCKLSPGNFYETVPIYPYFTEKRRKQSSLKHTMSPMKLYPNSLSQYFALNNINNTCSAIITCNIEQHVFQYLSSY